jgi:hypothetical protein
VVDISHTEASTVGNIGGWNHRQLGVREWAQQRFRWRDLGVVLASLNPEVTRNEAARLAGRGAVLALRHRWILQSTALVLCARVLPAIMWGSGWRFPIVGWRRVGRCLMACS